MDLLLLWDTKLMINILKDCSASGNQRRKGPPRGEADKAPTPTSLRPLSSSSWRVRYIIRLISLTVAHRLQFLSDF